MNILITGAAGFIGFHLANKLLAQGHRVTGLDNLNDYYDVTLKKNRLNRLQEGGGYFRFIKCDLADADELRQIFQANDFTHVVNLAAQAGVRYSLVNPPSYIRSNLAGFGNLLEECRNADIQHLIYASSSSVYGLNESYPYSTSQNVDHPVSLYAATKKSNELLAHAYSHLYGLPATGLRFFTVYGPWGRPDMSPFLFASAIIKGTPLKLFNRGKLKRDFTHVDDIVEGMARLLTLAPAPDPDFDPAHPNPATSSAPWRIYNIGASNPIEIREYIGIMEDIIGKKANIEYLPMQPGDVESTAADPSDLEALLGSLKKTDIHEGLKDYLRWHMDYYGRV